MEFENIIERLKKYSKVINKLIIGVAVLEAILVIAIGIASNNINTDDTTINKIALWSLIIIGVIYLLILGLKTLYNYNYPGEITNELKSERELFYLYRDFSRRKTISEFLITTIKKLNGQTCALNYPDDTHLCDIGIKDGVRDLISPIVENTNFLLDTLETNFTIGVYLDNYLSLNEDSEDDQGIIIIEDKLEKQSIITKDLFLKAYLQGEQLSIQSNLAKCFNNYEYVCENYEVEGNKFTIICSPMPYACNEEDRLGVFFIVSKYIERTPDDLATNLIIFNRVISNWVYRFNQCIYERNSMKTD